MNRLVPQLDPPLCGFTQLLSSTRRGARLARLLTVSALQSWGAPTDLTERAELVVAELAANAVAHGHVPGRDFRLTLRFDPAAGLLDAEVTDARGERLPVVRPLLAPAEVGGADALRAHGYGLALVAALADRWETVPHPPGGKTVRVTLAAPPDPRGPQPGPASLQDEITPRSARRPGVR